MTRTLRIVGALLLGASLVACGSDSVDQTSETSAASGYTVPEVTLNGSAEPVIAKPTGNPPTTLVSKDLVVGTGPEAVENATVTVNYTLMSWSEGKTLESSWQSGQPVTFQLAGLIPGWQQGLPGMKVGGKRLLIIPPDLAYGATGQGSVGPNETLLFVIELTAVQ